MSNKLVFSTIHVYWVYVKYSGLLDNILLIFAATKSKKKKRTSSASKKDDGPCNIEGDNDDEDNKEDCFFTLYEDIKIMWKGGILGTFGRGDDVPMGAW